MTKRGTSQKGDKIEKKRKNCGIFFKKSMERTQQHPQTSRIYKIKKFEILKVLKYFDLKIIRLKIRKKII